MPPTKIGAVVWIGRYDPTANESDRMPHNSNVTEMKTPTRTRPHGRFWLSRPRMIVDISVACGAGSEPDPIVITWWRYRVVMPITKADVTTPMTRPICCEDGVAPTM